MHLNQLCGYFGRSPDIIKTENVNRLTLEQLLVTRVVNNVIKINDDRYVILMNGNLNYDIISKLILIYLNINHWIKQLNLMLLLLQLLQLMLKWK